MAELIPAPFSDLVTRLYLEPQRQDAIFELPRRKWHLPRPDTPDMSVSFHGKSAGNPSGPAAGPHTQMAQNLLLSYIAGGRILELKTVQINDTLTIGRPCIDLTNVGYNIEWSQELLVHDSIREYVAGAMLIDMFRHSTAHTAPALDGKPGDNILDLSVGYDLKGIRSAKVRGFLDGMRNAGPIVEKLRHEIPQQFAAARDLPFATHLSDSITLSTFHGCPADEIERICEFLIAECDFDVIVKMNPPTLGKEKLEHLLFDVLGYTELTVNPTAYTSVVPFEESIQLARRLLDFGRARHRRVGFKFSNTLEVLNHRNFFKPSEKVMYLSGQPLHVITMTLTDEFRRAIGPEVPISFSAGIDQQNFPAAVACGFCPITISSDLLRPGGYGRLPGYLEKLAAEMRKQGAATIDDFIVKSASPDARTSVHEAALKNTTRAAEQARNDPRYRADKNRAVPKRIDSHLVTFDCVTCDKCLPVCPNAANFTYPTPQVAFDYHDLIIAPDGTWKPGPSRRFEIQESMQIANYADFCNECGNCDTFCPEYGGPYIKKPAFYGTEESWQRAAPRDGFLVGPNWIKGRIRGELFELQIAQAKITFRDKVVEAAFAAADHSPKAIQFLNKKPTTHTLNTWAYHTMRYLHAGILDHSRMNQLNAGAIR